MSGAVAPVQPFPNLCVAPSAPPVERDPAGITPARPVDAAIVASVKKGRVPTAAEFDTVEGTVVEVRPDRIGRRLSHEIFFVQVNSSTSPAVQGQVLEVDHDITPGIGAPRVPLNVGQGVAIRGVLWHDDDDHDGTVDRHGIHWTHHANAPGDAGCIAVQGEIYQ